MGVLDGKTAVITGGTRGLGLAIARQYAEAGAAVVVASRRQASVDETVAALRADGFQAAGTTCDVSEQAQVEALAAYAVEAFGGFDIWVNNAGLSAAYGPSFSLPSDHFLGTLHTNICGTYYGSRVAVQHFQTHGGGKLINLLGRGYDGPVANQNAYASSKAWIRSFTLAVAKEYKEHGIGVYAFNPGLVETDMLFRPSAMEGYEDKLNPLKTVIKLWGNPPEVPAARALWIAGPATDGKTGLVVDVLGRRQVIGGALAELWRRLTGRSGPPVELDITTVPAGGGD